MEDGPGIKDSQVKVAQANVVLHFLTLKYFILHYWISSVISFSLYITCSYIHIQDLLESFSVLSHLGHSVMGVWNKGIQIFVLVKVLSVQAKSCF